MFVANILALAFLLNSASLFIYLGYNTHPTTVTCEENNINKKLSNQEASEAIACKTNFLRRSLSRIY